MHRRSVRFAIVALLVAGGAGAGIAARQMHAQLDALIARMRDTDARVDALRTAVADAAAAQASYVAPGPTLTQAEAQVTTLSQQMTAGATALRSTLRAPGAQTALDGFTHAAATFTTTDTQIRQHLDEEDPTLATDMIFGESRQTFATMRAALADVAAAESGSSENERRLLEQRIWSILGAAAAVWFLGLIVFASMPGVADRAGASEAADTGLSQSSTDVTSQAPAAPAAIDLPAAADVCGAIARMTSAAALPDTLARAALVLDASGIILWMGAGEELFAASAYGYDAAVIARLGPIHRDADNATAAAWRTGELRTVKGDLVSNGAVVAPMWDPDTCIGVLAAEIRHGREDDTSTRAVASMLAAQLAAALSAWPSAGTDQTRHASTSSRSA
jgi:hypothetical protein